MRGTSTINVASPIVSGIVPTPQTTTTEPTTTTTQPTTTTTPPPPSPTQTGLEVYFWSDWSSGTGSVLSTLFDASKTRPWSQMAFGAASQVAVLNTAVAGRDYPTTNFIRFSTLGAQGGVEINYQLANNYVPEPQVGDSVGLRFYFRLVTDRTADPNLALHPTYFDGGGAFHSGWGPEAAGFTMQFDPGLSGDRFLMGISAGPADPRSFGQPYVAWNNGYIGLTPGTTYRAELLYVRRSTNEWFVSGRVYDRNGAIVIDEGQWRGSFWGQNAQRLIDFTRSRTTPSPAGARSVRGLVTGFEGADNPGTLNRPIIEYAAYAVCTSWCGAYPIAGVER